MDPFDQHDDAVLNSALRAAGLYSVQLETDEARLTLDSDIASGGGNLSVGQRQIIALARAIVRNSKLLILDEGMLIWRIIDLYNTNLFTHSNFRDWYVPLETADIDLFSQHLIS